MWQYKKSLEYPINIKNPNPKLAKFVMSQYGGADPFRYKKCFHNRKNLMYQHIQRLLFFLKIHIKP